MAKKKKVELKVEDDKNKPQATEAEVKVMQETEQEEEELEREEEKETGSEQLIVKANEAAERLEKANKDLSALLEKQVRLKLEATLGGVAEAGEKVPEKTKDEKDIAAAKEMLKGSGMEEMAFPESEVKSEFTNKPVQQKKV